MNVFSGMHRNTCSVDTRFKISLTELLTLYIVRVDGLVNVSPNRDITFGCSGGGEFRDRWENEMRLANQRIEFHVVV